MIVVGGTNTKPFLPMCHHFDICQLWHGNKYQCTETMEHTTIVWNLNLSVVVYLKGYQTFKSHNKRNSQSVTCVIIDIKAIYPVWQKVDALFPACFVKWVSWHILILYQSWCHSHYSPNHQVAESRRLPTCAFVISPRILYSVYLSFPKKDFCWYYIAIASLYLVYLK